MTTYLDVGVVRIGEYLTRVPKLKQLSAASAAITAATATTGGESIPADLHAAGIAINDEAGQADGVMHLTVATSQGEQAAREVLTYLRRRLPGAQLQASWVEADTYPEARRKMHQREGEELLWLPTTNEFPLARPCGPHARNGDSGCGQRPGVGDHDSPMPLCPDCRTRSREQAHSSRAEAMLDDLGQRVRELGALPIGDRPPESNHIASITMDGNGVGALFSRLIEGQTTTSPSAVSAALSAATVDAFVAATGALPTHNGRVPLIPVALGGDDVVVIVAAVHAWPFVREFQDKFTEALSTRLGKDSEGLSMTAGIVFHHVKEPITQTIGMAEDLMRHAKKATSGQAATVSWIDTTGDSVLEGGGPSERPVVALSVLTEFASELTALSGVAASALSNLSWIIDELDELPLSDSDRRNAVKAQSDRVGALSEIEPFGYPDDPRLPLTVALDLVRWWR